MSRITKPLPAFLFISVSKTFFVTILINIFYFIIYFILIFNYLSLYNNVKSLCLSNQGNFVATLSRNYKKMKSIVSLNANGLRAAVNKGFNDWISKNPFDIIGIQETKMDASMADPNLFLSQGYHAAWTCAEKKGYSGLLILSKEKPKKIEEGCGLQKYDQEGRILCADFELFSVINAYFPSGTSGDERHEFKMQFLQDLLPYFKQKIKQKKNLIVIGDYNIVHLDLDIHNPTRKDNPSGFRPEERKWMDDWFTDLFIDAYRVVKPNDREFSWWSYRAASWEKNKGWRIDYQSITPNLKDKVINYIHHRDIRFSDHCPIEGQYDL